MLELTRSMMSLSWASSLWGAEQLGALLRPPGPPGRGGKHGEGSPASRLAASLDTLSSVARRRMDLGFQLVFQAGDDLRREWFDAVADTFEPGTGQRRLIEAVAAPASALRFLNSSPAGAASRLELANKLEVYRLVRGVRNLVGLPPAGTPFDLEEHVARAYQLAPRSALWALEGLGHDYASLALARAPRPRGILSGAALPDSSLVLLHAGLGMALAESLLAELGPASSSTEVRGVLERFTDLCYENARDGYADAALESLGLMTRCFFPELVDLVDLELAGRDDATLLGYFWHGVGRALYFVPVSFVPGYSSIRHALAMAAREAPRAEARDNASAGVAYAANLVNMAHPIVLECFLSENGDLPGGASFVEGVVSSVLLRYRTTPADPDLTAFIAHRPTPALEARWRRWVAEPVRAALARQGEAQGGRSEVYRTLVGDSEKARRAVPETEGRAAG